MLQDEMHSARWILDEYWPGQSAVSSRNRALPREFQAEDPCSIQEYTSKSSLMLRIRDAYESDQGVEAWWQVQTRCLVEPQSRFLLSHRKIESSMKNRVQIPKV